MAKLTTKILATSMVCFMCVVPSFAQGNALDNVLENSLSKVDQRIEEKRFGAALTELEKFSYAEKQTYKYRFLKARVLTWSGNYHSAGNEFAALNAEFPNNPDVLVSYGYLEFFQGNLSKAETHFNAVLAKHPTYLDAYDGLQRTYALRNSTKTVSYSALNEAVECSDGYVLTKDGACQRS